MDFELKVSTEVLRGKAGEISAGIAQMERDWEEIRRTIRNSKIYWEGKSSNKHQKLLHKAEGDIDRVLERLAAQPEKLLGMAEVYESTESSVTNTNAGLPSDVIV